MTDLFRETTAGRLIRWATGNKVLLYPEERPDFVIPEAYNLHHNEKTVEPEIDSESTTIICEQSTGSRTSLDQSKVDSDATSQAGPQFEAIKPSHGRQEEEENRLTTIKTHQSNEHAEGPRSQNTLEQALSNALERERSKHEPPKTIEPSKTSDGILLVDWYTTLDPSNPQNWSFNKKMVVSTQIYLYTIAVYMGSSIVTPSLSILMEKWDISPIVATLGLGLYVLGYGTGPLIFSPLSELPVVGRNPPYIITFFIFVIISLPTALVNDLPSLLVLRFLQGFFGSPCLASSGASLGDIYSEIKLSYPIAIWAGSATLGPALGPVISGFSVPAENWHWSLWEILWLAGPVSLSMFFLLPETSADNILLRRAQRLRALTGNENIRSQSEINQSKIGPRDIVIEALVRPMQVTLLDPSVLFTAVYTSLTYGIYYSFFEVFPIVYGEIYGMTIQEQGLVFLVILIALFVAVPGYYAYLYWVVEPEMRKNGFGAPERRLIPALFVAPLPPIGLFIFGWTSREDIHFMYSVFGIFLFVVGVFTLFQCIFIYLPLGYPQYAASLFAGNDFARSLLAFAALLYSRPLYVNLGVARGISLLAGLTVGCIGGVWILYLYGAKLRAKSKFAA